MNILPWVGRVLGFLAVIFWLVMLIIEGLDTYLVPGILLILALLVTTLIAWQNEAIGASIFVILGIIYFIVIMGKEVDQLYYWSLAAFFLPALFFFINYFYTEKKDAEEDDF